MKPYILFLGLTALALPAGCDREAGPADPEPRAVVGTIEMRIGDALQRYDLRVDRVSGGFLPALQPIGHAGLLASRLARFPFVADSAASGGPYVVETPSGTVTTVVSYRRLGPWQVLDHATSTLRVQTPAGERSVDFQVALHDARLER